MKHTHEVKFHIACMRIPHIDKIPPKPAAFFIRPVQFIYVIILYQFFTCVRIGYQFFTRWVLIPILHMWWFDTNSSHRTSSSHVKNIKCEVEHKFYTPNLSKLTVRKFSNNDVLVVSFLHMMWNLRFNMSSINLTALTFSSLAATFVVCWWPKHPDPGFLERGFRCVKEGFGLLILSQIS